VTLDVHALICAGAMHPAPPGLIVRNFCDPGIVAFKGTPRRHPVSELILHETVTRDVKTTLAVLSRRRLGIHFLVGPDGEVTQHADPALTRVEHAAPHNIRSVGIEIVNPVEVRHMKPSLPWKRYIRAPWAVGGRYVLPTLAQVEAATQLVAWLTSAAPRLEIPRKWIGHTGHRLTMGRVAGAEAPAPGIYAHAAFHHADGSWPLLYAHLRLERGLGTRDAYDLAAAIGEKRRPLISLTTLAALTDRLSDA
jgi:hypothetical protein